MTAAWDIPIPYRIVALMEERNRLYKFPLERLAIEIQATKFRCNCCGACCTKAINHHIFLLDRDVREVKKIDPAACEPAPDPEFCDQNGILYVSGYALRMKDDAVGSCWFLENDKCRIYDRRFSICRTYPHMLRRSIGAKEEVTWQKFARPNEHGRFDLLMSLEDCLVLAREIKEYENAYLTQQIAFLETIHEYFTVHGLRHDPRVHRQRLRQIRKGLPGTIKVFHAGELEEQRIPKPGI